MRILVICGAGYVSGKEKIMFSLLKGFKDNGHEVFCITSAWGNGQFDELMASENISYSKIRLGFISKTFDWKAFIMTLDQLRYLPKMFYDYNRIVSKFKPDVIIHTNFHHLFLLYPVVKNKIVNIYHSHESMANTGFYKKLFHLFDKKIKLFVGVSKYVTSKLTDLGISKHKAKTIHNGLEIMKWDPLPADPLGTFRIGIAGQVGRWKGHEDLLLALDILKKNDPAIACKLIIFGNGDPVFIEELKQLINARHLGAFVEWKGFVKEIKDIYPGLQVVCIPSRSEEPFATSALEAGLFSIPVIVTKKGGFPEIVKDGQNGFTVPANNPGELAACLKILINDPAKAVQMGLNHREIVSHEFSYVRFISNWEDTLASLVNS
ncbi:MAG: glycosyltransferase family 4 protein [Ferruginibacter sp.]